MKTYIISSRKQLHKIISYGRVSLSGETNILAFSKGFHYQHATFVQICTLCNVWDVFKLSWAASVRIYLSCITTKTWNSPKHIFPNHAFDQIILWENFAKGVPQPRVCFETKFIKCSRCLLFSSRWVIKWWLFWDIFTPPSRFWINSLGLVKKLKLSPKKASRNS